MKAQELRELTVVDIMGKVKNLEEEGFNLRFQHKLGQLGNALQLRQVRRDTARARTILNEKRKSETAAAQTKR